ncbi:MAG: response regulator [Coprococcus sp.]
MKESITFITFCAAYREYSRMEFNMTDSFIKVLIVDDEKIIRQGLKYMLDWNEAGFAICGEADNGLTALEKIKELNPELVLMDIRMPQMTGTELMEKARASGYAGEFIILSGYSDFSYAQTAMHYGASCYLTKPIDEDDLADALNTVKAKLSKKHENQKSLINYASKAKKSILYNILHGVPDADVDYQSLGLASHIYQLVIYESYTPYYSTYNFADLLRVANQDNEAFEHISIENHEVIILKTAYAIEKFNSCLNHYAKGTEKGSPLDIIFLTYAPIVDNIKELYVSYNICCRLMSRRFFCAENQHVLSYNELPDENQHSSIILDSQTTAHYSQLFQDAICSYNRRHITELLASLKEQLYISSYDVNSIKYFLIDIFIQIKQGISSKYSQSGIPFAHNAAIIESMTNVRYLYELISYMEEQFEMIMRATGNNSSTSILDDILYYIEHNYQQSLKLETLAEMFGYNSSYLGKIFKERIGQNFNAYLDQIRIKHAIELLNETDLKVYEISSQVGYKNVDYFQLKFKKIVGTNPSAYRHDK